MLSRTADNLYWIARYMERADTVARLLEVGSRISLLPSAHGYRSEWDSLLQATGMSDAFARKYGDPVQRNIENFLFFDRDNPSSIASCITAARENGRIVRTALTTQVWDALNTAFQELRQLEREDRATLELSRLTDWTMRHAAMLRGAIDATLLRAMGAQRAFHWAYGGDVTAMKIADFLIRNPQSPRSLATCTAGLTNHLGRVAKAYGRETDAQDKARSLAAEIEVAT
ncbi:MAG: alpha-E domain-containing protein, partial [Acetobacteraceae bacterium]